MKTMCRRDTPRNRKARRGRSFPATRRNICPPEWQLLYPVSRQLQPISYGQNSTTSSRMGIPVAGVDIHYVGMWTNLICYEEDDDVLGDIDDALTSLGGHEKQQTSHIFTLPFELLWKIFDDFEIHDIIVMSTTCRMMFKLTSTIIARDVRQTSGFHAHQPLSTVGRTTASLPQALLRDEMASKSISDPEFIHSVFSNTWQEYLCQTKDVRDHMRAIQMVYERVHPYKSTPRSHLHYIELNRHAPFWGVSSRTLSRTPRRHTNPSSHRLLNYLLTRENQICVFDDPSSGTLYYLRNHTTHNLVRVCNCPEPHISSHSEDYSDMETEHFLISPKLDDIFVMMTRHYGLEKSLEISASRGAWTTGPWSGHRFDIVSAKRHAREFSSSASPVRRFPQASSTSKVLGQSPSPPTTAIHWRDVTSAVVIRACWEHDRIIGRDRIVAIGSEENPDQVRKRRISKRVAGRWGINTSWLSYMDAVYPDVAALLENGTEGHESMDVVEAWRKKYDEIIERWEEKWKSQVRKRPLTRSCLVGEGRGDAEKGQEVGSRRRSERLMSKRDASGR